MNARMADLRRCFESAGFSNVTTVLSSGNVVFDARSAGPATLERKAEAAMARELDHVFGTIVRPVKHLQRLLGSDPYEQFDIAPAAKRIVTFLRRPTPPNRSLPIEMDGARILSVAGLEVFSAYVPGTKGPVFMSLIEKTFGKDVTTRTLETVRKCAAA
jgi:uncharacterized protein (DUF1697 family)